MSRINQKWILRRRPEAAIAAGDLEMIDEALPAISAGEIIVRNLYLSLDPTNRIWMSDRDQYLPPVNIGNVMRGSTIGMVEESRSDRFAPGDIVIPPQGGWQRYTISRDEGTRKLLPNPDIPLTAYLSVLGSTGLTAYFGLVDVCKPQSGETLVVSAAAGAVGSVVGQIAKIKNCRVIGIAGGAAKCSWISDDLGFDAAIDYKKNALESELDHYCPDGIDMSFENVGGSIMDAVFSRLKVHGRMALCGMISGYNDEGPLSGPTDFGRVLMKRLTIRGFLVIDYFSQARTAFKDIAQWIQDGRIKWKDHVVEGLDGAPSALERLFTGDHDGKLIVRISDQG